MKVKIIGKEIKSGRYNEKDYTVRKIHVTRDKFEISKDAVLQEGVPCNTIRCSIDEKKFEKLEIGKEYTIAVYYDSKRNMICNEVFGL